MRMIVKISCSSLASSLISFRLSLSCTFSIILVNLRIPVLLIDLFCAKAVKMHCLTGTEKYFLCNFWNTQLSFSTSFEFNSIWYSSRLFFDTKWFTECSLWLQTVARDWSKKVLFVTHFEWYFSAWESIDTSQTRLQVENAAPVEIWVTFSITHFNFLSVAVFDFAFCFHISKADLM